MSERKHTVKITSGNTGAGILTYEIVKDCIGKCSKCHIESAVESVALLQDGHSAPGENPNEYSLMFIRRGKTASEKAMKSGHNGIYNHQFYNAPCHTISANLSHVSVPQRTVKKIKPFVPVSLNNATHEFIAFDLDNVNFKFTKKINCPTSCELIDILMANYGHEYEPDEKSNLQENTHTFLLKPTGLNPKNSPLQIIDFVNNFCKKRCGK